MDDQNFEASSEIRQLFLDIMENRAFSDYVIWKPSCSQKVLRDLGYSPNHVNDLLYEHVKNGKSVKYKPNPDSRDDDGYFGAIVLDIDDGKQRYYLKFVFTTNADPQIYIVSAHLPGQSTAS